MWQTLFFSYFLIKYAHSKCELLLEVVTCDPVLNRFFHDGCTYDGFGKNGVRHGHGVAKCVDTAESYIGNWINGKRNGDGVFEGPSYKYDGQWKDDKREGFGRSMQKKGGVSYEGQWYHGQWSGRGTYRSNDLKFVGEFRDHSFSHGVLTRRVEPAEKGLFHSCISTYNGSFESNLQHGHGVFELQCLPDGGGGKPVLVESYVGDWVRGERDGEGVSTDHTGQQRHGHWTVGVRSGDATRNSRDTTDSLMRQQLRN